jgi:hypothetical protein
MLAARRASMVIPDARPPIASPAFCGERKLEPFGCSSGAGVLDTINLIVAQSDGKRDTLFLTYIGESDDVMSGRQNNLLEILEDRVIAIDLSLDEFNPVTELR